MQLCFQPHRPKLPAIFAEQSDDELYRVDFIPKLPSANIQNGDLGRARHDSGFDAAFVARSVHHEVAGTIFLQRRQSSTVITEEPVTRRATQVCNEIDMGNEAMDVSNAGARKPSYLPEPRRVSTVSDDDKIFIRRRSISTPLVPPEKEHTTLFDPNYGTMPSHNLAGHTHPERPSLDDSDDSPGSPGRASSPLSEPPPSPPLYSADWWVRKAIRVENAQIERVRVKRIMHQMRQEERREVRWARDQAKWERKKARQERESEDEDQKILDLLMARKREFEEACGAGNWPYIIPPLDRQLRSQVLDKPHMFDLYLDQGFAIYSLVIEKLSSLSKVSDDHKSEVEEGRYLRALASNHHSDATNIEDLWGMCLIKAGEMLRENLSERGGLERSEYLLSRTPRLDSYICLLEAASRFPELKARLLQQKDQMYKSVLLQVKSRRKYEQDSKTAFSGSDLKSDPKPVLHSNARKLDGPSSQQNTPETAALKTPGGRVIPRRVPFDQPSKITKCPGKKVGYDFGRPLTPPGELYTRTRMVPTVVAGEKKPPLTFKTRRSVKFIIGPDTDSSGTSSGESAPQSPPRLHPSRYTPEANCSDTDGEEDIRSDRVGLIYTASLRAIVGEESSSTDSSTSHSSDSSSDSTTSDSNPNSGNTKKTRLRQSSIAQPALDTVLEVPESVDIESTMEDSHEVPPSLPNGQISIQDDADEHSGSLNGHHEEPQLDRPSGNIDQSEQSEHLNPNSRPTILRAPSLTSILDCLSNRPENTMSRFGARIQVPRIGPLILPLRSKDILSPLHAPSTPTQSSTPVSRISTMAPGTPMNSPSPALSNDVTDEGPIPSRLVERLETEQSRRTAPRARPRWADGANEEPLGLLQRIQAWTIQQEADAEGSETDERKKNTEKEKEWLFDVD